MTINGYAVKSDHQAALERAKADLAAASDDNKAFYERKVRYFEALIG